MQAKTITAPSKSTAQILIKLDPMMRKTERKLEMRGKKKGETKWEKIGWNEDKKFVPLTLKSFFLPKRHKYVIF